MTHATAERQQGAASGLKVREENGTWNLQAPPFWLKSFEKPKSLLVLYFTGDECKLCDG
uniref:Uncharacterized protein n=1 Tax=Anguilla anguilla TaxID=7936 RepID=A0A0E9UGY7_ANGAN